MSSPCRKTEAHQAGLAIENARLFHERETRNRDLAARELGDLVRVHELVGRERPVQEAVAFALNDGSFARFYVETLHRLTGKPVLVAE